MTGIAAGILEVARRDAVRVPLQGRALSMEPIRSCMLAEAKAGKQVVRLSVR